MNDEVVSRQAELEVMSVDAAVEAELEAGDSLDEGEDPSGFAADFMKRVLRLRGVKIQREDFLRQELRKLNHPEAVIAEAIATTPLQAGVTMAEIHQIAVSSINFETRKSAALSFTAGLPGGFGMLAAIPADITQYYVHAFRVMQKLAYVHGWQDFLGDLDEVDDETIGLLAVFLGVMMGVGGASASLSTFAQQVARPALQKKIAAQALTKTTWYGPVKQTLRLVGVKVTKDSFAKTVTKTVPLAGGVISGGLTLVSLSSQSARLHERLRELPPPGVDAAEYAAALEAFSALPTEASGLGQARSAVASAADGVASGAKNAASGMASGAKNLAGGVGTGIKGAGSGAASLLSRGRRRGQGNATESD